MTSSAAFYTWGAEIGFYAWNCSVASVYRYCSCKKLHRFGHAARRLDGELIKSQLLPTPPRKWRWWTGGQLKMWTTTIKAELEALSGPRVFGYARWTKDWAKASSDLAQDRRASIASVRAVLNSTEDARSCLDFLNMSWCHFDKMFSWAQKIRSITSLCKKRFVWMVFNRRIKQSSSSLQSNQAVHAEDVMIGSLACIFMLWIVAV